MNKTDRLLQTFNQLSPDIPFEQVIDWVRSAPGPVRANRWQRWWGAWWK